jgi:hypothetical protein
VHLWYCLFHGSDPDYFRIPRDEGNKLAFAIMNIQDRLDDLLKAMV